MAERISGEILGKLFCNKISQLADLPPKKVTTTLWENLKNPFSEQPDFEALAWVGSPLKSNC